MKKIIVSALVILAASTATPVSAAKLEIIKNTVSVQAAGTEIHVGWGTNIDSDTHADWGTYRSSRDYNLDYGADTRHRCDSGGYTTSHCIVIKNLRPHTTYAVVARSCTRESNFYTQLFRGNCAGSKLFIVTTGDDSSPPDGAPSLQIRTTKPQTIGMILSGGSDNVDVVGYHIYRDNKKIASVQKRTTHYDTVYHDNTISPGKTYYYSASSYDAKGLESKQRTSPQKATAPELPPDDYPPSRPSIIHITAGAFCCKVELSWEPATDDKGVTGYKVFRNDAFLADVKGTKYTDTAVKAGATYTYYLQSVDTAKNLSEPSSIIRVTVPAKTSPTPAPLPPPVPTTTIQRKSTTEKTIKSFVITPDKKVDRLIEGDKIFFKSEVVMSDGSIIPVTSGITWSVLGGIGTVNTTGVFEAALAADVAELGEAVGTVVATYTDTKSGKTFLAKSSIITVELFVSETVDLSGSIFRALSKLFHP